MSNVVSSGPGRPQGDFRGASEQANELAGFLRQITRDQTVRQLAVRYMGGRTAWSLYRSGAQLIPLHLLEKVVGDRVADHAGREMMLAKARGLHQRAAAAPTRTPTARPATPGAPAAHTGAGALVGMAGTGGPVGVAGTGVSVGMAATGVPVGMAGTGGPVGVAGTGVSVGMAATGVPVGMAGTGGPVGVAGAGESVGAGAAGVVGSGRRWSARLLASHGALVVVAVVATFLLVRQESGSEPSAAPVSASLETERLVVVTPAGDAVRSWDPSADRWTTIGGPAAGVFGGGAGLWAAEPIHGGVTQFHAQHDWSYVAERPAELVVGRDQLFRLGPDRTAVWAWSPGGDSWELVGGPARHLYAGQAGTFATSPDGTELWRYDGSPGVWSRMTDTVDPADQIVVGRDTVYRLTGDRAEVQEWDPAGGRWLRLGGAAATLRAGGAGLVAVDGDGGVLAYRGRPDDWERLGDGAADVAVGQRRIYRLGRDGALSVWSERAWRDLGASARAITVMGR